MTITGAFFKAAQEGNVDELEAVVKRGYDVNATDGDERTALHWAVTMNHPQVVEYLVRSGATVDTVDEGGVTPLMSACSVGAESTVELILEHSKADINAQHDASNRKTALFIASSKSRVAIAKKLMAKGASPKLADGSLQTCVHRAVIKDSADLIEMLIDAGADVNAQDNQGDTPLHYAAMENNKDIGCLLIQRGASKEITNKDGKYYYEL